MPRGGRAFLGLAGLALCCSPTASPRVVEPLHLTHIRPSNPEGVFLNEEIVFYFDQALDPVSVTSASLEILSESRLPARGDLRVEDDHVRFVPLPVLATDLSDGGYLPGTRYTATLSGFPRADGVRGSRGALLQRTIAWSFRTVRVDHPRTGLLFEDRMQNKTGLLRLFPSTAGQGGLIRTQDSIYLACDKPIDPSTVSPEAFQLRRARPRGGAQPNSPPRVPVPIRVRVIENEPEVRRRPRPPGLRSSSPPEVWEREPRAALVEITPATRLTPEPWELVPEAEGSEPRLRDFGGRPVVFATLNITADDSSAETGGRDFREEFESRRYCSPVAVPGYDGTALWGESGRVEVRYPAAAGAGGDGSVVLDGAESRRDVQATSIELGKEAACELSSKPGLVVLRCQGRMAIRGNLSRVASWDPKAEPDPWVPTETLSGWLTRESARDGNWTVLIAGGDLEISGTLRTTTPLLLVAGGRIRVQGIVEGVQEKTSPTRPGIYLLRDGGGYGITPDPRPAPLVLDEPQGPNPLKQKLRFAALSGPIPQRGAVLRWLSPESGGSVGANGTWKVLFVHELASTPIESTDLRAVESPALLDPPGPVQFLVELEVHDGGVWNPPWIDYVHLSWEQPQADGASPR